MCVGNDFVKWWYAGFDACLDVRVVWSCDEGLILWDRMKMFEPSARFASARFASSEGNSPRGGNGFDGRNPGPASGGLRERRLRKGRDSFSRSRHADCPVPRNAKLQAARALALACKSRRALTFFIVSTQARAASAPLTRKCSWKNCTCSGEPWN